MAAPIQPHSIQVHDQAYSEAGSSTFSQRATSIIKSFNRSDLSPEDAQTQSRTLMDELFTKLNETSPNFEEAREVFAMFLCLGVEVIPNVAINTLTRLLAPETIAYDLANSQASSLLSLEKTLSETIEHFLRRGSKKKFLIQLLGLYEDVIEHIWLLPHLSNDPGVHATIVQQGVPPILQKSDIIMTLLQKTQHHSQRLQTKYRCIAMAYERLGTPIASWVKEKIQQTIYQDNSLIRMDQLADLYQDMQDFHRAIYYYKRALLQTGCLEKRSLQINKLRGGLYSNLGIAHQSLDNFSEALECHKKALAFFLSLGDRSGEEGAYINLGVVHQLLGKSTKSIKFFKKALSIAHALEDVTEEGRVYTNLGVIHRSLGNFSEALRCHKKVLSIAIDLGDRGGKRRAFEGLGIVHQSLGNFSEALKCHKKALSIAIDLGDRDGKRRAFEDLGIAYQSLGNFSEALKCHKKALSIAIDLRDRARGGRAYGNLGFAHQSLYNFSEALECHKKALAFFLALGDRTGEGNAYVNLGNAHQSLCNYALAIEYYEKSLAIAQSLEDRAGEGNANCGLGNAHESLSNHAIAIEYYEKSLAIAQSLEDRAGEGRANSGLGNAHESLSNYSLAIEYHEKSLAIAQSLGDRAGEGIANNGLGNAHQSLGNYSLAIECYEKGLAIAQSLGDRAGEAVAREGLGAAYCSFGHYLEAFVCCEKAIELFHDLGNKHGEVGACISLGNANCGLGNYPQAIQCHKKALEIAIDLGGRAEKGAVYTNLGIAYDSFGKTPKAIECLEEALKIVTEQNSRDSIGGAHSCLGIFYIKHEEYAKAEEHFQQGILAFSHIQHSLENMYHAKITIFEKQSGAYLGLEHTLLLQDKYSDALVISDSRRSRILIDQIQAKREVSTDSLRDHMEIEEMQELAEQLGTTFVVYAFNPSKLVSQTFCLNEMPLVYVCDTFQQESKALRIWVIDPRQVVYRSIEAPSINKAFVHNAITPFQTVDTSQTREGNGIAKLFANLPNRDLVLEAEKEQIAFFQDWYNELIAPIIDLLPSGDDARITLVPDSPLLGLPFALLMDPKDKYLFERYTISTTPSIKTLQLLMQRKISPSEKNLIVGNPIALNKSPLPYATIEAQKVAKVTDTLPEHTLIEGNAHKTTVLAQLENFRFIHLACHGFAKAKGKHSIYEGAFYLTPDDEDCDGILYAEEIVTCDLNAELVMLSACHSGKGRQQREGVIGPVRSFIAAGAQSVVATLWALPDSELTIAMVSQFYKHILGTSEKAQTKGCPLNKDEALREVMRMAASGPERNHPQKWGAFFMTGALQSKAQSTSLSLGKEKEEEEEV